MGATLKEAGVAEIFSAKVASRLEDLDELYHRLVLVVAPSGSGKTATLADVAEQTGGRLVNLNLELSKRLIDLSVRQRALQLPQVLQEVVGKSADLVLLDNIEILFDVSLQQDPLRLLQALSRNRTVVAAWNGIIEGTHLLYATPDHPEYRRYSTTELVVVCPEAA
jgi:hypothetical protein